MVLYTATDKREIVQKTPHLLEQIDLPAGEQRFHLTETVKPTVQCNVIYMKQCKNCNVDYVRKKLNGDLDKQVSAITLKHSRLLPAPS